MPADLDNLEEQLQEIRAREATLEKELAKVSDECEKVSDKLEEELVVLREKDEEDVAVTEKNAEEAKKWEVEQKILQKEKYRPLREAKEKGRVKDVGLCKRCGLWSGCRTVCVSGSGDLRSAVWFVGEAPGNVEDQMGVPFVGPSGGVLDELLRCTGLMRDQVYIDNVVKCRPLGNRKPTPKQVGLCSSHIKALVEKYRPKVVMLLGASSLRAFVGSEGITRWRGKVLTYRWDGGATFLVPTFHPAAILRDLNDENGEIRYRGEQSEKDVKMAVSLSGAAPRVWDYERTLVQQESRVLSVIQTCRESDVVAVDIETTGLDPRKDRIIGISLSKDGREGWYIPWSMVKGRIQGDLALGGLLAGIPCGGHPAPKIVMHNAKFDLRFLRRAGFSDAKCWLDTMLAHHMLDENFSHSLKELAWIYTDLGGYEGAQAIGYDVPPEEIYEYACNDAIVTWQVGMLLRPSLEKEGLDSLFFEITMPLIDVLVDMEESGITFDRRVAKRLQTKYEKKLTKSEALVYELAGVKFNINSVKQLRVVLFEKLGLPSLKSTKTRLASTDEDVLKDLQEQPGGKIAKVILEYRKAKKVLSTYVLALQEQEEDGVVHTDFLQHGTTTGRLASRNPNLQNVSNECRGMFRPPKGCKFVDLDFKQAELRVATHYTRDPVFLDAFEKGQDIHTRTAADFYGVALDKVTEKQRFLAKSINFGLLFGRGSAAIAKQVAVSREEGERLVQKYFETYEKTKQWMTDQVKRAESRGYVKDPFGRRRRLHDTITADDVWTKGDAERQALNSPIQSGAATATYVALIRIWWWLKESRLRSYLVLTVHDSIMACCPEEEVDQVATKAQELMEQDIPEISVPMKVDVRVSDTWEKPED